MIKSLLLITCLFISQPCFAGDTFKKVPNIPADVKSVKIVIPIYSQKIAFRLPASWKSAFQDQKPSVFTMEFTPKSENIDSWQNLLTIQGFESLASRVSPEQFLLESANSFKSVCGEALVFDNLGATTVDGFKAHRAILGCAKVPNQNFSELAYWLVIQGYKDIYVVQKAIRSVGNALSSANVDSFFSDFSPIELCKSGGEEYECRK